MAVKKKATVNASYCVACGACAKVCPRDAVTIMRGIVAVIDWEKCIGCGKCVKTCPACLIDMEEVTAQ